MSKNYSILFDNKIPSFIRDDENYQNFIDFFQEYYTWFNDTYTILDFESRIDIDSTFPQFLEYFKADFLPGFPNVIATDTVKLIKIAKELYKAKGIPDSFKFLFRALYNNSCEVYPTRDVVLRASDGKWVSPKSVKIKSVDPIFLNLKNFKLYGELSQTIGIIESAKISGKYTQIYLSNIDRLYFSGEPIKILDSFDKDVYFLNGEYSPYDDVPNIGSELVQSKIIGALSKIDINPKKRGQFYNIGDPVIIEGGLSTETLNPVPATAEVTEVTLGEIEEVTINDGGFGYSLYPNTIVNVIYQGKVDSNAVLTVNSVDTSNVYYVSYFPSTEISQYANNIISQNANTTVANSLTYKTFPSYPITGITVENGGYGYTSKPSLRFYSTYQDTANTVENIYDLGILGPIRIINGGVGYSNNIVNNYITISGGDGHFAYAKIDTVDANGTITAVSYYSQNNSAYAFGGMGYRAENLPTVTVTSNTGSNAILQVAGVVGGQYVDYTLVTDRIGAITKITLLENGEDYVATPNVSLRVMDVVVSNVSNFSTESIIYQGVSQNTSTFRAFVASIELIDATAENIKDYLYSMRLYNYKGKLKNEPLKVYSVEQNIDKPNFIFNYEFNELPFENGRKIYGDGLAKATATFLNGLIVDQGRYLNSDGFPSEHSVIESDTYNNYTYILETEKDYDSYNNVLRSILHPTGSKVIAKNILKSNVTNEFITTSNVKVGINYTTYKANLVSTNTNFFNELYLTPNTSICIANNKIKVESNTINVYSTIKSANTITKKIKLNEYIQYKFPNVFNGYAYSNSIIITEINYGTSINNVISIGDTITLSNNSQKLIALSNNVLLFSNNLFTNSNTVSFVSVIKDLNSNNITIY